MNDYITDPEAMKINKIDLIELKKIGVPPRDAILELNKFCQKYFGKDKVILGGNNIKLDISFLKIFYNLHNFNYSDIFSHKTIDIGSILYFLSLQEKINKELVSFNKFIKFYDIDKETRHTALGDAEITAAAFTMLLKLKWFFNNLW